MIKNKYFEKIISKLSFFPAHFRFAVFMIFAVFLFYIAMLGIEIISVINNTPSADDINKKIQSVGIRRDLIKKIDNFIALRQKAISGRIIDKNPFLPYPKDADIPSGIEPAVFPAVPSPEMMP